MVHDVKPSEMAKCRRHTELYEREGERPLVAGFCVAKVFFFVGNEAREPKFPSHYLGTCSTPS